MKKQLLSLIFVVGAMLWSTQGFSQCSVLTGPHTENFDSYSSGSSTDPLGGMPCWKYYESGVISSFNYPYGYLRNSSSYANSGSQFLYMYKSSSSSWIGDSAAFMSAKFDLSAGNYEVIFSARTLSTSSFYSNKVYVGVCDSAGSVGSITVVDTVDLTLTTHSNYSVDLTSANGVGTGDSRVVFMMIGDGSTGYAYIDDVTIRVKKSCNDVTNLTAVTSTNGVSLSWDGATTHTSYTIEYDTAGFTPGNGTSVTITSDSTEITGLTPVTNYDFYVKGNCSATSSSYAVKVSAFSPCAAVATPFFENFDAQSSGTSLNPSLPNCWEYYRGISNSSNYATYQYTYSSSFSPGYSGTNSLRMYASSFSGYIGDTSISMTPQIQGLDSASKMIEFYGRKTSSTYDGEFYLTVANANGDVSSIRIVDTVKLNSTTYEKYTYYLDSTQSGDSRVGFMLVCDGGTQSNLLDNIQILDIPPCPEPIALSLTGATRTSATIAWSSSSTAFNIELGPVGYSQGTGTSYTSTTTSFTATGLASNTYYDAYVMANCTATGDGTSNWVGPFTFKTECGSFAAPYTETFGYSDGSGNSGNPDLPDCWQVNNYSAYSQIVYVDKSSWSGNQLTDSAYLYLRAYYATYATGTVLGDTVLALLPMVDGLANNDKQLLINGKYASSSAAYNSEVIIATMDSVGSKSSLAFIDTITFGSTYADYTVDLDNVPANASRVALVVKSMLNSGYSYGYNWAYIDEVTVRDAPQCPEPFGVVANVTSDSSAVIDWSDSATVSNYFVEWGQSGFTQGTGATIDTVSVSNWSSTSLMSGTTYDVYIQSECASQGINSPWYGPITLETPCEATSKPYIEGFENLAGTFGSATFPNLADCWVQDRGVAASYMRGMSNTYGAYAGNGYVEFWGMAQNSDTVILSSPPIENLSTEGATVTFYASLNSASYLGEMQVGSSDWSGSLGSTVSAADISLTTGYSEYSVYLDSTVLNSNSTRVAFIFPEGSNQWNDIRMDSVTIEDLPTCGNYDHTISGVTDTSANVAWKYFGNDCFNIEYGLVGFIQGTGVGSQSGTVDSNITSSYTISGLNPNTSYDFYVENCCNPGQWEGPFSFTTECTGPLAAGSYSVGPTGDFATLDSVMSTLSTCGIGGAVTFEFQTGTFSSGVALSEVNGSSASNTITFTGASGASDTLVSISLNGASNVILHDLFVYNPSGDGIVLNGTDNVTISNNTIEVTTTSTSTIAGIPIVSRNGQYYYNGAAESNLTVTDNVLIGGYFGISIYGSSSNRSSNVEVSGNEFRLQYYYGGYLSYVDDLEFSDNSANSFRSSSAYGARFWYCNGLTAHENEVSGVNYGLYIYRAGGQDNEVVNNMLDANVYGIYNYFSDSVSVYHNTLRGNYGMYNYYGSNYDIRNNIFAGNTYAIYERFGTNVHYDYNVYNSGGFYLAYTGSFYSSLSAWQSADSTQNMNSVEGDPVFINANDLHVVGLAASDAGDNSVGVMHDIDGDVRPSLISSTVDIGADEYDVVYNDAALTSIMSPSGAACGGDSIEVVVEVTNLGVQPMTSADITVTLGAQTLTGTYSIDTIGLGESDAVTVGYISQFVGGIYNISAEVDLTGDSRSNNDVLSETVEILDAQQVVPLAPDFACAGDVVSLSIGHPSDGSLMWSTTNGDTVGIVDADSTLDITLTQDTTLTLSALASQDYTGNVRPIGSGGGNYTFMGPGVLFTVTQTSVIDSVTLYPNAAGTTSIAIQDAGGTTVWTTSVATTATGNSAEQVYLGASVQPGSYRMVTTSSTTGGLYREFGVTGYPFSTSGGEVSITQGTLTNYHYFFYYWVVTVGGCERADSTITIQVHPDPVASVSVDTANATVSATDWTASWSTAGTSADSVFVEFSNGTTSNDSSGTVTFTANMAGESVTVIAFGPCTSDTATFTFDVNQISVDEDFMNGTLSIYPNPTRGLFNVEFATMASEEVEISIVNMVGQVISRDLVTVNGVYQNQFDLSEAPSGVYFISFKMDEGVLTERITVE